MRTLAWPLILLASVLFSCAELRAAPARPAGALAPASACAVVRGYFEAIGRKDYGHALALTTGAAQTRTAELLGELARAAREHGAEIELKVRSLQLLPERRWFFSRVARQLDGRAQFYVEASSLPHISAIVGSLGP
jgi:hypothetical protein